MTKDARFRKLMPAGQPRFIRTHADKSGGGLQQGGIAATGTVTDWRRPPTTPDSGFSDGGTSSVVPAPATTKELVTGQNDGDYGTSSVIHVVEPDVSAGRSWWHTRGFASDPYIDGTLLPPGTPPRSKAALEAEEVKKRALDARAARRKLLGDAQQVEPLLQTVPIRPTTSREGPRPVTSGVVSRPSVSREGSRVQSTIRPRINSSPLPTAKTPQPPQVDAKSTGKGGSPRIKAKIVLKKGSCSPRQQDGAVNTGGRGAGGCRVSSRDGINTSTRSADNSNDFNCSPRSVHPNRITIAPPAQLRPATKPRPPPLRLKGPLRSKQDIRTSSQPQQPVSIRRGAGGKRSRPATTPVDSEGEPQSTNDGRKLEILATENHEDNYTTPGVISMQIPPSTAPAVTTTSKKAPILIRRPQRSRASLTTKEGSVNDESVEISTFGYNRKYDENSTVANDNLVKSQRKVSFITENVEESRGVSKMEDNGNKRPVVESKFRKKRSKVAKNGKMASKTQRQLDDDFICGVAAANRFSRQETHPNQVSQVTSESEEEEDEDGKEQQQRSKNQWELFEDQVKSIDDGVMFFSPRDLTSKSSDLFEKVMVQIGPQFRKSKEDERSPHDGHTEEEEQESDLDDDAFEGTPNRGPRSSFSKFRSKQSWGLLRKNLLDKQMDSEKKAEASLNWRFLCTTITNLTDVQRGREALYQKYIYEPNSWLKGFTNLPPHVLKNSLRQSRNKDPGASLRHVQSANGQRTVTVGHQPDEKYPTNAPLYQDHKDLKDLKAKTRASSTQGRIRVAADKPGSPQK